MLLHLPTGAGKTVIVTLIIDRLLWRFGRDSKVLFVAHRKELLDQTAKTLQRQIPRARISIEQGERTADLDAQIIIASIQSLMHRKNAYPADRFSAIICDECHRALAPRWLDVIDYFHEQRSGSTLLLGMTATPRRTDGRSAVALFDTVAYAITKPELQDLGYLVPVHYWSIRADLHLDRVKLSGGDFQLTALSRQMNTEAVRGLTLGAWQARGKGKKTLAFCASVAHARQLAADFAAAGYRSAFIDGRTRDRGGLLGRFAAGEIDVLFNYGVLTEGFDDPTIECLLMARPTTSPLVYNQCLGRGLRPHSGKHFCTVIDIVDRTTHQLQYGACEFAGLPRGWRSRGRDPFRESRALGRVRVNDPDAFAAIRKARSLDDVQDLLMALPPEVIVAGLDGEPVPYYEPVKADAEPDRKQSENALRHLLRQAGAPVRRVEISAETIEKAGPRGDQANDSEIVRVRVRLGAPHINNERFEYLLWHLERATGWMVEFARPARTQAYVRSPRAILRSILPEGQRIVKFAQARSKDSVIADVSGMQAEDVEGIDRIQKDFQQATGLTLELRGQLAFGF